MTPRLDRVGAEATPVLTLDGAGPPPAAVAALASALAPFPAAGRHYPGLRRIIDERDRAAFSYVRALLEVATPYLAGAFDLDEFELIEASFSLVTTPAAALSPVQRAPHFDDATSDVYAILHYIASCAGTAFFRHRKSGIEQVTAANVDRYVTAARAASPPPGYVAGDNADYTMIGRVAGTAGRLAAYPAGLLHSGIIAADFVGSSDPTRGRLTTNIFIRGRASRR